MPLEQTAVPWFQTFIIPYAVIIGIFYFLVIKPQRNKQNEHKKMLANLKKNDEIVTSGGIHATIVNVKDKTVIVRIDDNAKMEIDREAVVTITKVSNA